MRTKQPTQQKHTNRVSSFNHTAHPNHRLNLLSHTCMIVLDTNNMTAMLLDLYVYFQNDTSSVLFLRLSISSCYSNNLTLNSCFVSWKYEKLLEDIMHVSTIIIGLGRNEMYVIWLEDNRYIVKGQHVQWPVGEGKGSKEKIYVKLDHELGCWFNLSQARNT